jgi:uncharacterized protein involved in propanediol utilization
MVEDDAFCTKTLSTPSAPATLTWDNGIKWVTAAGWKAISATHFAKAGEKLSVNSSGGPILITLPLNPNQFDEIVLADHYNSWGTNNVTILRSGSLIENLADDLVLNTTWPTQITLRFEGSTWRVYSIV